MGNTAIRGSEVSVRIAVAGQLQRGTFLRCKSATATPRTDLVEDDYLGEAQSELDMQHHGWDLSITFDEDDDAGIRYTQQYVAADEAHQRPPEVTVTILPTSRDGVTRPGAEVYPGVMLKQSTRGFGGRKERVANEFEGKSKTREVISL